MSHCAPPARERACVSALIIGEREVLIAGVSFARVPTDACSARGLVGAHRLRA